MSADDHYYVNQIEEDGQFHIWHTFVDSDELHDSDIVGSYNSAAQAIVAAHRAEAQEPSVWGVSLGDGVLRAAEKAVGLPPPLKVV